MASKLGGVGDRTVVPARGQIVIVRNDARKMLDVSGTDDGVEYLDIIRHGVKLRPVRTRGVRIEKERMEDVWVMHNYGAGGVTWPTYCCENTVP